MPKTRVNKQGFEYNEVMKRYVNECDSCQYPMTAEELQVAQTCQCPNCKPWVLCIRCHEWKANKEE